MKIVPPVYFLAFLVLGYALNALLPILNLIGAPYTYLGVVVGVLGFILGGWAIFLFNKNKTTLDVEGRPSRLVTYGPYQLARNPIYSAMALILFGEAVFLGSLMPFIAPILFVISINSYIIPDEEKLLEILFKEKYAKYKKKVRRWGI